MQLSMPRTERSSQRHSCLRGATFVFDVLRYTGEQGMQPSRSGDTRLSRTRHLNLRGRDPKDDSSSAAIAERKPNHRGLAFCTGAGDGYYCFMRYSNNDLNKICNAHHCLVAVNCAAELGGPLHWLPG